MKIERMDSREIRAELSTPCYPYLRITRHEMSRVNRPFVMGGTLFGRGGFPRYVNRSEMLDAVPNTLILDLASNLPSNFNGYVIPMKRQRCRLFLFFIRPSNPARFDCKL